MTSRDPFLSLSEYDFLRRKKRGDTKPAERLVRGKKNANALLLVGYGGTISSGYTPTRETIVPLFPSPAIKQIEYVNLFGTSCLEFESIELLAKDSRELTAGDLELLLDVLHLTPHKRTLISAGTYMLPKLTALIQNHHTRTEKHIALTGSILPAGFVASDADANIWSAISVLNDRAASTAHVNSTFLVFHGRVFDDHKAIQKLNLHPQKMHDLVIQYPLTTVPTNNIL